MSLIAEACYFRGADGALLHFDVRDAGPTPRGVIVTVHGLGEHLAKYREWHDYALERGYNVAAYDQRGHGRTPGRRGDFEFEDLVTDLERFIGVTVDRYGDMPVFIVAHSLGALVALEYASGEVPPSVEGMALTSTPLVLANKLPGWYQGSVRVLSRVAPRVPIPRLSNPRRLTRDPERLRAFSRDPFYHRVITARALVGIERAMEEVRGTPESVEIPVIFFVAREDRIVSGPDIIAYGNFVSSHDVTIEQLPGAYHEILNDYGRRAVYEQICDWFDARAE